MYIYMYVCVCMCMFLAISQSNLQESVKQYCKQLWIHVEDLYHVTKQSEIR